jgi:YVTN family beta-propeller protein
MTVLLFVSGCANYDEALDEGGPAASGGVAATGGVGTVPVGPPGGGASGAAPVAGGGGASGISSGGTAGNAGTGGMMGDGAPPAGMRDVLLVGNSVAGTVSFIDARTFENLGSVNVIADFDEVMGLITLDLVRFIAYPIVTNAQLLHHFEPAAGKRFVDDIFVSPDGTILYVSRSNLGDVAAFDLTRPGHPRIWRNFVESPKADHAAISPDGTRIVVSATGTSRVANMFDARTGAIVGSFTTGFFPHQNDYTADGKYIYNSSIGDVRYGAVSYANNMQKGDRWLVKVDAETLEVVKTWVFDFGIRPNVITPDEKVLYTQLSYLNGVVKYDLENSKELARSDQPLSDFALETYATYDEYPHDSAHHGLAISGDGTKLCDCGTIDNTVAIISTPTMQVERMIDVGMVPYWATTGPDGRHCFVTLSGDDAISIIDYDTKEELDVVPVGKFPQRSRLGRVPEAVIAGLAAADG